MPSPSGRNDRLLTLGIVILSVAGILYFGFQAVQDQADTDQENPYALDLSVYDQDSTAAPSYTETQTIPLDSGKPTGLALDHEGFLYVSAGKRILKYDPRGEFVDAFPTSDPVYSLTVDRRQRIYLGMRDRVEVIDRDGGTIGRWASLGPRAIVTSIAVTDSTVFLADAGQLLVWRFATSGALLGAFGRKDKLKGAPGFVIPSPYFDVAVDPDGATWVANTGRHSLENYSDDGSVTTSWGEYGTAIDEFCGCCNPSHFAILPDGGFVTSEKGVPRVKLYNRQGQFVTLVAGPDAFRADTEGLGLAVDAAGRIYVLDPVQNSIRVFTRTQGNPEGIE